MIVKQADIIIEWLKANDYHENEKGNWFREPDDISFLKIMFKRCGKSPTTDIQWDGAWLEHETYSTIRLGKNHRAHIFDHNNKKVLCGVNRFKNPPFKINVKELTKEQMGETFFGYSENRGGPNPNKFTCIKCENALAKLLNIETKSETTASTSKIEGNPDLEKYELEFDDVEIRFTNESRKNIIVSLIHSYLNKTAPLYNPDTKQRINEGLAYKGFWKAFDGLHYIKVKTKTRTTPWFMYYMSGTKVREAICKKHNLNFKTDDIVPTYLMDNHDIIVFR